MATRPQLVWGTSGVEKSQNEKRTLLKMGFGGFIFEVWGQTQGFTHTRNGLYQRPGAPPFFFSFIFIVRKPFLWGKCKEYSPPSFQSTSRHKCGSTKVYLGEPVNLLGMLLKLG